MNFLLTVEQLWGSGETVISKINAAVCCCQNFAISFVGFQVCWTESNGLW